MVNAQMCNLCGHSVCGHCAKQMEENRACLTTGAELPSEVPLDSNSEFSVLNCAPWL